MSLKPGMLVSIFPNDQTDAGLGNPSSTIQFDARGMAWESWDAIRGPDYPAAAKYNKYEYYNRAAFGLKSAILLASVSFVATSLY